MTGLFILLMLSLLSEYNGKDMVGLGWAAVSDVYPPILSVVILTYNKPERLQTLLQTMTNQNVDFLVEIIVADTGCFEDTRNVASFAQLLFLNEDRMSYIYAPICTNPGFAFVNNKEVMERWINSNSKWLLFLHDDVYLHSNFLQDMMEIAESKPQAGAVGCMILNTKGDEIVEAGGIVWMDGTFYAYGKGRKDLDSPDLTFARQVDYVSGTCLMVQSKIFEDYCGLQGDLIADDYYIIDLQMHLQHELNKEVWLQPRAKLNHHGLENQRESTIREYQ
jgi:O-antigen biosynthesis protein